MSVPGRQVGRGDVILLGAVAAVVMSVAIAALAGRTGTVDDRARAIEAQLRCPTCQGLSIVDSPATAAAQMRALVREQLDAGASDDQVRAFFVVRYGRWILLDPPLAGADVALWLAPVAILGVGAALVVRRAVARERAPSRGRWVAAPVASASRYTTVLVGLGMVVALVAPIVAAVGPRLAGSAVSGGMRTQAGPSIEDLEAFVRAEPRDVEALVALGDALAAADRDGEAAERYKAAIDVDPGNVAALLGIGAILLAADRPDGALLAFERILARVPDQPDALLYAALARLRLNGAVTEEVSSGLERFLAVTTADDPRRTMAEGLLDESPSGNSSPVAAPAGTPSP